MMLMTNENNFSHKYYVNQEMLLLYRLSILQLHTEAL